MVNQNRQAQTKAIKRLTHHSILMCFTNPFKSTSDHPKKIGI
jgi:hypothetical protein